MSSSELPAENQPLPSQPIQGHGSSEDTSGDVFNIGSITDSSSIAIGRNAQVHNYPADPLPPIDPVEAAVLLTLLPTDSVPNVATLPPGSRITLQPNALFTGRQDDLQHLAKELKAGRTSAVTAGIGGVGKTSLAVEFAHRYGQYFAGGVFWLSFANKDTIAGEIAACGGAGALRLPGFEGLKFEDQVQRVLQEWQADIPRLLIFDNCEDPVLVRQYRPATGGCRMLITSRNPQWEVSLGVAVLPLDVLPRSESIALLRRFVAELSEADANALAEAMGDLPLALHLTGSFLARYRISVTEYLEQLAQVALDHQALQGRGAKDQPTNREMNLARAFALSYDRLDANQPIDLIAQQLLARAALFAPGEPFPRYLLLSTVPIESTMAQLDCEDALQRLIELGLIEKEGEESLRMHRLLTAYAEAIAPSEGALEAVEEMLLFSVKWAKGTGYPTAMEPYIAHLRLAVERCPDREDVQAATLVDYYAGHLERTGAFAEALPLYKRGLAIREQVLGLHHPDSVTSLDKLAGIYRAMGMYAEALEMFQQALMITESTQGPEHPDTAASLNNLATLYTTLGEYSKALPLLQRAFSIITTARSPVHPDTAMILSHLASLYVTNGEYNQALPMFQQALMIQERIRGENHPDTATSLRSLGKLYRATGAYEKAMPLLQRALMIHEQTYGANHHATIDSLDSVGLLYREMGAYSDAVPLLQRALKITELIQGMNHPNTAVSSNNLGELYSEMGNYEDALPLLERALNILERYFESDNPKLGGVLNNLGKLHYSMGSYEKAQPLLERAYTISERAAGANHPDTAQSLNNLGVLYLAMERYSDALPLFQRSLAIEEAAFGSVHLKTVSTRNNLSALYQRTGAYEQAISGAQEVLKIIETSLGRNHAQTATSLSNLAGLYVYQKEYEIAASYLAQAYEVQAHIFGSQSANAIQTKQRERKMRETALLTRIPAAFFEYFKQIPGATFDSALAVLDPEEQALTLAIFDQIDDLKQRED